MKKILSVFFLSAVCYLPSYAQDRVEQEIFNSIEENAEQITQYFQLNLNTIVLNTQDRVNQEFAQEVSKYKHSDNSPYLASMFHKSTTLDGVQRPGCTILVDALKKNTFLNYEKALAAKMIEPSFQAMTFFLTAHEMGHCVAQKELKFKQSTDEKYADLFAYYFIYKSSYAKYLPQWIEILGTFPSPHNTRDFVDQYNMADFQNLNQLANYINNKSR